VSVRCGHGRQRSLDRQLQRLAGARFGGTQEGLDLRPGWLDRREIRRVRRQVEQPDPAPLAGYILEGLLQNRSEIRPDTIHPDTQGQSETVFGLAHLLAIQLMPRIRHGNNLTLYAPSERFAHEHIARIRELFGDPAEWHLI
jgi:hypothetical protein